MVEWAAPLAFWLSLTLIPIIVCYFLRMRFRRQPVSSIYIWSRLRQTVRGGARLRWLSVFLLLLQILAAMAAVTAIAQPILVSRQATGPGTVFLLDTSCSMGAVENGLSRLEQAIRLAADEIQRLPADNTAAIFACGADAELVAGPTTDRNLLLARLRSLRVTAAAFREARVAGTLEAWLATQERSWQACLIGDGGLDLGGRKLEALFPQTLRWIAVGTEQKNIGLSGLRLLPGPKVEFSAYNGWPERREVVVTLERDEQSLITARLSLDPGTSRHSLRFAGEENAPGAYAVRLVNHADALAADDCARLAVNRTRPIRVLLLGTQNPFLLAAFRRPGVELSVAPDFTGLGEADQWDLVVADQVAIPAGLETNLLAFGQAPPDAPLYLGEPLRGRLESTPVTHPLQRYLNWQGTEVALGRALEIGPGVQSLAEVNGRPLLAAWESDGLRRVVCGTTTFTSNFGLSGAFPVFIRNLLQWCVPQADNPLAYTLTVGEPASLAEPADWRVRGGQVRVFRRGRRFTVTALAPGFYQCGGGLLAANPPAREMEIAPRALSLRGSTGPPPIHYAGHRRSMRQWPLAALLLLLCAEWYFWRGGRLPRLGSPAG